MIERGFELVEEARGRVDENSARERAAPTRAGTRHALHQTVERRCAARSESSA